MKQKSEIELLAQEFNIRKNQAEAAVKLLDEDNTVPFIARYRKEQTGGLTDVLLRDLSDRLDYLRKLDKRTDEIYHAIDEQGKMTEALAKKLASCQTLQEAEVLYMPYKRKKHTRAMQAREQGLEPLAKKIADNAPDDAVLSAAASFVDSEKGVESPEKAVQGAMDIVAEELSEDDVLRKQLKQAILKTGRIKSSVDPKFAQEKTEFMDYYDAQEPVKTVPNHRILAMNRGEKRGVLKVGIQAEDDALLNLIRREKQIVSDGYYDAAVKDSLKRLIFPSIEREIRSELKDRAEEGAIKNFGINLKNLLLQRPFKGMTTMGFDPGFSNGCKIAVLDAYGSYLEGKVIHPPFAAGYRGGQAERELIDLIERNKVDLIAIGNGTASRESEQFIADVLKKIDRKVQYMIVNEAGASIYSASKLAQEEYPELDVSIRGAISIAGRLQDPLSELIKIEPGHIGVGQYQHDVNQKELARVLDHAVEDAVTNVGADLNRSSAELLSHIVGITKTTAKNIVDYREVHGGFTNKEELIKVKGIGPKAYEQSVGFMRVPNAEDVLDRTGIHPESYALARKLMRMGRLENEDVREQKPNATQRLCRFNIRKAAEYLDIPALTIIDILNELKSPGRDPRDTAPEPFLKSDVLDIKDLKEGMELTGTVRNVIDFGAFVDIGVHQDGLVHISQIPSETKIKHPSEKLAIGDVVTVRVLSVDVERGRIALTMK